MATTIASPDPVPNATVQAFPSADALPRAVLVRNISPLATMAALEDCFSFCGPIEELRLRSLPAPLGAKTTQQAVLVFPDELARADALKMDQTLIADAPVTITAVPTGFDFEADPSTGGAKAGGPGGPDALQQPMAVLGGGLSAFGSLFADVSSAVAAEVERASTALDKATDSGVLKSAKDQVALAHRRTRDFAADLDSKWHLSDNVRTAATAGRDGANAVASAVAKQTAEIASTVDNTLHISEGTNRLAENARSNDTVNSGLQAVAGSFSSLLAQTGLRPTDAPPNCPTPSTATTSTASSEAPTVPAQNEDAAPVISSSALSMNKQ